MTMTSTSKTDSSAPSSSMSAYAQALMERYKRDKKEAKNNVTDTQPPDYKKNLMSLMMQPFQIAPLQEADSDFSNLGGKNCSYPKGEINNMIESISKEEKIDPAFVKA